MAVGIHFVGLSVMTTCSLVDQYQHFGRSSSFSESL